MRALLLCAIVAVCVCGTFGARRRLPPVPRRLIQRRPFGWPRVQPASGRLDYPRVPGRVPQQQLRLAPRQPFRQAPQEPLYRDPQQPFRSEYQEPFRPEYQEPFREQEPQGNIRQEPQEKIRKEPQEQYTQEEPVLGEVSTVVKEDPIVTERQDFAPQPAQKRQDFAPQPAEKRQDFAPQPAEKRQDFAPQPAEKRQDFAPQPAQKRQDFAPQPAEKRQDFAPQPAEKRQDFAPQLAEKRQDFAPQPAEKRQDFAPQPVEKRQDFVLPSTERKFDRAGFDEPETAADSRQEQYSLKIPEKQEKERLEFQVHGQQGPHSYRFGYDTGSGYNRQFRFEERDADGNLKGRYGYYKDGKLQVVNYSATHEGGFHAEGDFGKFPEKNHK